MKNISLPLQLYLSDHAEWRLKVLSLCSRWINKSALLGQPQQIRYVNCFFFLSQFALLCISLNLFYTHFGALY